MSLLAPAFLFLGALAGPIILLYMLRLRRREVLVSSTLLWRMLLRDREANAPWQRLRRNLLLLLQLLILAALVFALARPFVPVASLVSGNVVVLLDGSPSMQATDVQPNRFEVAKEEVAHLIDGLGGNSRMTLIKVGKSPEVLATASSDRKELRNALRAAEPEAADPDWESAFALAAGAAQGYRDAHIVLVSDGGLSDDLPPLPVETNYISIGESAENLAISALATRDTERGTELFASISNMGTVAQEALFTLNLPNVIFDSRRVTLTSGQTVDLSWELPEGTTLIEANLTEIQDDFLSLDNRAWAVHAGGVNTRVLIVTAGNIFLEQAFASLPGFEPFKVGPESALALDSEESFGLYVFDGVSLPDPLPDNDILVIDPLPAEDGDVTSTPLVAVSDTFSNTATSRLADSPLLQFVDWSNVHVMLARRVSAPWAQPLIVAEGGPLISVGERNGRRLAIFSFNLHDSDLPLQIAFPVLMANITGWLSPGSAFDASGLKPGEAVSISPAIGASAVEIEKPDGSRWTASVGEDAIFFTETDHLGVYRITMRETGGDRPAGEFTVNLFSSSEANIAPRGSVRIGQVDVEVADNGDVGQQELWPWLLGLAFVILLVEWWVHYRGARLPAFTP